MDTSLDIQLAEGYKSPCQRARVVTEGWFNRSMYCPACSTASLSQARDNTRVVDFFCLQCCSEFQLKAKSSPLGRKLRDAAYQPMMDRILANRSPHFAFLQYDAKTWMVRNLLLVPGHFITPQVIEKCAPLSAQARRSGWVGCNILTEMIPADGRIYVVVEGVSISAEKVRAQWKRFLWLSETRADARGWLADVLRCVRMLGKRFTLSDLYRFEKQLAQIHPENQHIREKIRQQMQFLRDRRVIRFLARGRYEAI